MQRHLMTLGTLWLLEIGAVPTLAQPVLPETISVDPEHGDDANSGSADKPLKTISSALRLLADPLEKSITIRLAAGSYSTTGADGMPSGRLELMRRMRPGITVSIKGADTGGPVVLAWESDTALIDAREGDWWLENVQVGTFTIRQRRGVMVTGPASVTLKDVTFQLRSQSDAGIYAQRGGHVSLRGRIALNAHVKEQNEPETFCGIIAEDHGVVRFREREGGSLTLGNGSLSASYYGVIRLGCSTAQITTWSEQSNTLAVNNSGRIDLHGTSVTLDAKHKRNTPIGLEHDGHVLGEDARLIILSENAIAIALQKASTLTCNDIELRRRHELCLWASSGSMFVGRFKGDLGQVEATTGANINIEQIDGKLTGPVIARHAARISLPDRDVLPD